MIQRIQTLFLLVAIIISGLMLYLPVYELVPLTTDPADVTRQFMIKDLSALLIIVNGAIAVLAFIAIFLYKKRNLQIRMGNLALLVCCALIGLLFFGADTMSSGMNQKIHYLYGSYLPLIQVLFLFLAVRYIKRDEELIRSADRLR